MLYPLIERQVKIRTSAAMTHTAFAGSIAAAISPAAKAIGVIQDLHLLIFITLYILRRSHRDVTDILKKSMTTDIITAVML